MKEVRMFLILCIQHEIWGEKKCKDKVSQRKETRGINQDKSTVRTPSPKEPVARGVPLGGQKTNW